MKGTRLIFASSLAASAAVVSAVLMTTMAELWPALKSALAGFTGHHWTSKSIIVGLVYLVGITVLFGVTPTVSQSTLRRSLWWLFGITAAGIVATFLFFVWEYLFR